MVQQLSDTCTLLLGTTTVKNSSAATVAQAKAQPGGYYPDGSTLQGTTVEAMSRATLFRCKGSAASSPARSPGPAVRYVRIPADGTSPWDAARKQHRVERKARAVGLDGGCAAQLQIWKAVIDSDRCRSIRETILQRAT